jgi:MYXO-CTERM domain-containing protein
VTLPARLGPRTLRSLVCSALVFAGVVAIALAGAGSAPAKGPESSAASGQPPVFAYYYIWFNPTSWNRAKTDYPRLGRYSSDERAVMRQHIEWAKQSGIDGFLVSWKSTETLDRRLEKLIGIAQRENFKLGIIYQGLDFHRRPLPAARVATDLEFFARRFAKRRPFRAFDKPLVIWSGTWKFSRDQVASVTKPLRDRLLILASEKNVEGYERIGDLVDGDAYYWSSVNPETYPSYREKLSLMGQAIHSKNGLWIAPAAAGFDALLIGGTTVVERKGGDTLRRQYNTAVKSSPDAIGLISWNEFSENSHIEPSEKYGARYLQVLADIRGTEAPKVAEFDSSEPASSAKSYGPPVIGALAILLLGAVLLLIRRRMPHGETPQGETR